MQVQEWLGADNQIGIDIWEKKYQVNGETFDEWLERVSGGDEDVKELIWQKKFLFGGRILANRGVHDKDGVTKTTYSNCFSGDTQILTLDGIKCLKSLEGKSIKVLSQSSWRDATVKCFGEQPVKRLTLKKSGAKKEIVVTGDHIWFVMQDNGMVKEVKTDDLQPGMRLQQSVLKCYRKYKPSPFGVAHGFYNGDGDHVDKKNKRVNICKGKEALLPYYMPDTMGESGDVITVCGMPNYFHNKPPLTESSSYLYGWLAGYFAADGCIDERGQCVFTSTKIEDLEYVRDVLCVLGLPVGSIRHQTRVSNLNGKEGTVYILGVSRYYLNDNFFILTKHKERANNIKTRPPASWSVESVSDVIGTAQVYCAIVPDTQSFTLDNSILTHNCYVIPGPEDNLESIFDCAKSVARTFSYGGGVGIDISKLAPAGAKVRNAAKESSGAVSFMDLYSTVTGSICQGTRRGALMISMSCEHPDIEQFIDIKKDLSRVTKANISVRVTDKFMEAVINDQPFELEFTRKETGETISKTVSARELMMKLAYNNWDMGEPGVLFWDRIESWNMLSEYHDFHYAGVNPCAEEPLPAGGSCLLGSINLSEFVNTDDPDNHYEPYFNYEEFNDAVAVAIRALNDVLDEGLPLHPLQIQRDNVRDWRQIGLGIFGLADMLIKLGIKYGSQDAVDLCDNIGSHMIRAAYTASVNIGRERAFPKFDRQKIASSKFFEYHNLVPGWPIGNSQLLTIAPTGTLSTMLGVSGGIEPIYANSYERKTESLHGEDVYYKVYTPIVQQYMTEHGITDEADLPDYFVTAKDIDYHDRIKMQAAWQQHIDASISSTINLPNEATPEDIFNIYIEAYKAGLKGVTVFRDGCRRAGILSTHTDHSKQNESNDSKQSETAAPIDQTNRLDADSLPWGSIIEADDNVVGKKRKLITGCGSLHCVAFFDPDSGDLVETYLSKGSNGGCQNFMIGLSRMISLAARSGAGIEAIVDQLESCGVCPSYAVRRATKHDTSSGSCCPVAVGRALKEMWEEMLDEIKDSDEGSTPEIDTEESMTSLQPNPVVSSEIIPLYVHKNIVAACPECGEPLVFEGGCNVCKNCGWSKCS